MKIAEYISRETAIAKLTALEIERPGATMADARRVLADMPPVDVAPVVHGQWIEYPRPHYFKCSECKCTVPYKKAMAIDGERKYKYCPSCWAKMDKQNESEN